jgi:4-amino-4-deoxy-L-arabinose transferase-like glycosyltransferase
MAAQSYRKYDYLFMGILALLACSLAVVVAWGVTERLPHLEDEIAYLFQARTFARGALWAPVPDDTSAFFTPFVLNLNGKRVGKYTIGWPLVLALGELFGAGWLVNPVLGGLMVAVVYAIARDLYDRETGVIAGVLAATSPFYLIQSSTYMSHAAACLWTTLLMWTFLRVDVARDGGRSGQGWAGLAGFALGMLALTRLLTAVAVGLPFAFVLIVRALRRPREFPALVRSYWPLVLLASLVAGLQPLYLYVVTGNPTTNLYTMVWAYDRVGFGPEFGRFGHTPHDAIFTTSRDLKLWASELFGWRYASWVPLIPGLVAGVREARPHRRAWPFILVAPFVMLVAVYMAYWIGSRLYGPRYYYEGHAGLAVVAALGLRAMAQFLAGSYARLRGKQGDGRARPALLRYLLLVGLLALSLTTYLPRRMPEWHGLYGITRAPLDKLEKIRQTERVLVLVRSGHWREYAPFFFLNSPWYDDPVVAAHDNSPNRSQALMGLYAGREIWFYNDGVFSPEPSPYSEDD